MNRLLICFVSVFFYIGFAGAIEQNLSSATVATDIVTSSSSSTILFETFDITPQSTNLQGNDQVLTTIPGEGMITERNRPMLPLVSRFVVVPPDKGLEFKFRILESHELDAADELMVFDDENGGPVLGWQDYPDNGLYPPMAAEMSEPAIIRGVRIVKVTVYPVQYNEAERKYIIHDRIETEIEYTDAEPVNQVLQPVRRHRSQQFLRVIDGLTLNGNDIGRDDPDFGEPAPYVGHYLIVTIDDILEYSAPFIEWRRKSGYKVDILSLTRGQAGQPATVKREIQNRYDAYLDDGMDPFDYVHLIGDRSAYENAPGPGSILQSEVGVSVWGNAPHADYLYGCLEGGDHYPDVGISRWPGGARNTVELMVGRTLGYEATPYMEDTSWYTRGGVYSQHWGNGPNSWNVVIHTNVRWGEEVLKHLGFDNIIFYENYEWDQYGVAVARPIREMLNNQTNITMGRAEIYYYTTRNRGGQGNFNEEIDENTVFPMDINTNGHGEWGRETMYRTGSGDNLKGWVTTSNGWGWTPTGIMNALWLEMVNAIVLREIPLGWGFSQSIIAFELYFPDFQNRGRGVYLHCKTDFNTFGDPGIIPWRGVPQIVEANFTETISPQTSLVEVQVVDPEDDSPVAGARVTFYVPGDMPDYDNDDYADYENMLMKTVITNEEGMAAFVFNDNVEFEGRDALVTVSGYQIVPFFGEIAIRNNLPSIELLSMVLEQQEGNDDDNVNPGEQFALSIIAVNLGDEDVIENVTAVVSSSSPWLEIENPEIEFGDIGAGEAIESENQPIVTFDPACPDGAARPSTRPEINLEFHSGELIWKAAVEIDPVAPKFKLSRIPGGNRIEVDRNDLNPVIENLGRLDSPPLNAELVTRGMGVGVVSPNARYPEISAGDEASIAGDQFVVSGNALVVPGSMYELILILSTDDGFVDTVDIQLQVGETRENAPLGPDNYGYVCFDDTDADWDIAPEYNWIEISLYDREPFFEGTECDFDGRSVEDIGESQVVDLGFDTQFYGHVYNQITITTNGYIAMGSQPRITNFLNWPMDRAFGGGSGIIAPLWDDLKLQNNNSGVFYYYDEDDSRFIVEWYKLNHRHGGNDDLTFQVIIYDKDVWVTESGDPQIIFQYNTVSNRIGEGNGRELHNPFASVGIYSPDGDAAISYSWLNQYPDAAAPLENQRAIMFATAIQFRSGLLFGRVTDAETGEPVPTASIRTEHGFAGNVDEDGRWEIPDALAEIPFSITASAPGYNDSTLYDFEVEEDDSLEINYALLHPEFDLSEEDVWAELEPNDQIDIDFTLRNDGNGPLEWNAVQRLVGDANADPWEHRQANAFGELLDDSRLYGITFFDDIFYISGSNDNNPTIYMLNRNGELVDEIEQPGEDNRGMKDLAYDGELIWGSIRTTVYGMTTDGEVVTSFDAPYNPTTVITWDSDREILWVGGTTTDPVGFDREGNRLDDMEVDRNDFRIYGLAYFKDDPDNAPLYIFHKERVTNKQTLHKYSFETEDTTFVTYLEPDAGGSPQGAFITNTYDVYSWVFMSVANLSNNEGGDRVDIWQIDARRDWFRLDHDEGILESDESDDFTLTFNSNDLPIVTFEAEIVFYHNAVGGTFTLPVTLDVLGNRRNQMLNFIPGWNLISSNAIPEDLGIEVIFNPLVEEGVLEMVKNADGQFFLPQEDFNNIDGWVITEAYQVSVSAEAQLQISGGVIASDHPIDLEAGWNLAAYFPRIPMEAPVALASIEDELIIAKDGWGNFYLPEFDFDNMGEMIKGQGYQIKLREAAQLVYNVNERGGDLALNKNYPEHFSVGSRQGENMSVLVLGNVEHSGYEIGAFVGNGRLIGAGCFNSQGRCGFAVWGDDLLNSDIDGAESSEDISLKLWDGNSESDLIVELIVGELSYQTDGHLVGTVIVSSSAPIGFGIHKTFPNPTNGPATLMYALEEDGLTSLQVFDLSGRLVETLVDAPMETGTYQLSWDTTDIPSGLYLMRLAAGARTGVAKIAVLK